MATVHFECNIGDTLSNNSSRSTATTVINNRMQLRSSKRNNVNFYQPPNNTATSHSALTNHNVCLSNKNIKGDHNPYINLDRVELDELSMPTTRSTSSDLNSTDSDTLRNDLMEYQPLKVFLRRSKQPTTMPLTPIPSKTPTDEDRRKLESSTTNGTLAEERRVRNKSPRSLFLGLGDD